MNDAYLAVIKFKHLFQKDRIYVCETGCNHIKLVPYVNTTFDAELLRFIIIKTSLVELHKS